MDIQCAPVLIGTVSSASVVFGAFVGYVLRTLRSSTCTAEGVNGMAITTTFISPGVTHLDAAHNHHDLKRSAEEAV